MGLFGRDDRPQITSDQPKPKPEPKPQTPRANVALGDSNSRTTIAPACAINGDLQSSGDISVEGQVSGSIDSSAHLFIAESGRVKAKLHGRNVTVAGNVTGDITADERIELDPSAAVNGNIIAPRILIKDGATFEGQVFMKSPSKVEKSTPPIEKGKDNKAGKPKGFGPGKK